jgi:iron complex outermembrane receptor protein
MIYQGKVMHLPVSLGYIASLTIAISGQACANTVTHNYPPIQVIDQADQYRQFGKVEITGSSVVRKEQTQALPVQVITRDDIRRSGLQSINDVVQSLPLMGNFVESSQLGMVVGGYSNAAIHGMPNGTLLLVDGLRLAPFGRQTMVGPERSSVDLSTLLLADVERIEVLTDGASSLYGTDAMAGVVNIILRKERKGFEITANALRPAGGAGKGWVSSIGWGKGTLASDRYSLLLTAELSQRNELLGGDRPYASAARYAFDLDGQRYATYGDYLTEFTSPAGYLQINPASGAIKFVNALYQNGACIGQNLPFPGQEACSRNAFTGLGIYPQEEAQRLHARGEWAIQEGHTFFTDLLMGRSTAIQSNNWWPEGFSAAGLPPGSAAHTEATRLGLDPTITRLVWRPDLPALRSASVQDNGRLQMGLRGEWQAWNYRSTAYFTQSRAQSLVDNFGNLNYSSLGLINNSNWSNDNVVRPLDATNPLTAQLEALRGGLKRASIGTTRLYGLQANASRVLTEINGKDVLLGMGVDLRTETSRFVNEAPPALQTEPPAFDVRRQVRGVYTEAQIPVTPTWEINLGARSDQYSDVGRTTNAKAFSRWEIDPQWSMRGSVGTGFRAPTPSQTAHLPNEFVWGQSNYQLSCNAQQQALASQLSSAGGTTGSCIAGSRPYVMGNGNRDLKPETSTQVTWGMAFTPHRNLRLAADFWAVQIKNTIQTLSPEPVLNDPVRYAAHYRLIPDGYSNSGTTPGALALYLPLQNLGVSEKSGVDLEAQWRQPGDWGRWHLTAQATYLIRSRSKATPDADFTSNLGRFDESNATVSPRLKMRWVAGLSRSGWTSQLIMNHTSGYTDSPMNVINMNDGSASNVTRKVSSFTTWDLQVLHTFNRQLELRAGVRNLLNKAAPLSFAQSSVQVFGANTVYSNLWGRTLDLGMTFRF